MISIYFMFFQLQIMCLIVFFQIIVIEMLFNDKIQIIFFGNEFKFKINK
jgi:hypothetical protein